MPGATADGQSASTWYYTLEYLKNETPSHLDGMEYDEEMENRRTLCAFLQEVGKTMQVPQLTIATAIVFFHRFFLRRSFKKMDRWVIGTTCLFLAGKVEETPKKLNDVISVSFSIRWKTKDKKKKLDPKSIEFLNLKEAILIHERVVLQTIAFDLTVEHPYKHLLANVKKIGGAAQLAQVSWNFVNDSLRTTLSLQFPPQLIACAAIYLASKFLKQPLPEGDENDPNKRPWHVVFGVEVAVMEEISNQILDLYERTQPSTAAPAQRPRAPQRREQQPHAPRRPATSNNSAAHGTEQQQLGHYDQHPRQGRESREPSSRAYNPY